MVSQARLMKCGHCDASNSINNASVTHTELKEIRKSFSMTQREFAEFLGVSYSILTKWESDNSPVPSTIQELIKAKAGMVELQLTPEELVRFHTRLRELNKTPEEFVAGLIRATI